MQTLKTAAIVVLLMTVMYGAYVSLTTPPEPLPADVQDMLVIDDDGTPTFDTNLPDSLGSLNIDTGSPTEDSQAFADGDDLSLDSDPMSSVASFEGVSAEQAAATPPPPLQVSAEAGVSASLNDNVGSQQTGVSTTLSDLPPDPASGIDPGPPVSDDAAQSAESASRAYPRTNSTFQLPDPNSVKSTFDSKLALASGVSDSSPNGVPVSGDGVSPISSLGESGDPQPSRRSRAIDLGLSNAIRTADKLYGEDKRKEALATLSIFYNTPNLSGEQRSELLSRLDPLAREVIYSTRHLLHQPHRVGQNETLMEVAAQYEVPWQLLANINQIDDPITVLPGTELKVVQGPFRAEVNISTQELTLFLDDLYAGRFPIGIGNDPTPRPGTFTIQDKQVAKTYYDAAGAPVPPGNPNNPYGEVWLDLGGQLCIHGSPSTTNPTDKGCISLAADFADDLYGILSQGSSVRIRR